MSIEADRKLAGALVLTAWAVAVCAIGDAVMSDSSLAREHPSHVTQSSVTTPTNEIQQAAAMLESESRCLAEAIYYEARGESAAGQLAVAEVVINRVRSGKYPATICGVVYQGSHRTTGCQFSFTCDGSLKKKVDTLAFAKAERVARGVVFGQARNLVGTATHYHANYTDPYWAGGLEREKQIGRHIFYSAPRG